MIGLVSKISNGIIKCMFGLVSDIFKGFVEMGFGRRGVRRQDREESVRFLVKGIGDLV